MKEWKKLSESTLYKGYRNIEKWTYELPSGLVCDYEIKIEGKPVCVLALTPENKVIIAKQFRPGPAKVLFELPGGGSEDGEESLDAIKRELLEETGYSGDFQFTGTSLECSYSTLLRSNFIATNCRKVTEPENAPREPIVVMELDLAEFREHLRKGEMTDVATAYLGLDYLSLL